MAEEYAFVIFDSHYRPSDELEDRLAACESWLLPAIDRVASSGRIEPFDRVDIARLLGLQALRYPDRHMSQPERQSGESRLPNI